MKILAIITLLGLTLASAEAQVLDDVLQKFKYLKSISYIDVVKTKFSFEDTFSIDTLKSDIKFVTGEQQTGGYYRLESTKNTFHFDGNKLIILEKKDSTYRIKREAISGQHTRTLLYWVQQISLNSKANPKKIKNLADTIINGAVCAHVQLTLSDTLKNDVKHYTKTHFFIDKATAFPICIRTDSQGVTDEGLLVGMEEVHAYSGYETAAKKFPDLSIVSIPDYFRLPSKTKPVSFLVNGTSAPKFALIDMEGNRLDSENLKGRTVLLNFTSVSCPHCISAVNMLNRIANLYKNDSLLIANVYPLDDREAIMRFNKRFTVNYLSFTVSKTIQDIYPYEGYPSFYLIDKHGTISHASSGYYPELADQLVDMIDHIK